ncbi:MAG: RHS repeat-associated core domain-containing protein, partial [Flammeovirgaceae bacterium]
YVWVSNESENTEVWFDDVNVIHQKTLVAEATDYETWGGVLREQKWEDLEGKYRWGYQGQYSERDQETNWNHFELREYDPVIGRTNTTDPYGEFWSSYLWVSNDPINGTDPDGGYSKFWANIKNFFNGGSGVYKSGVTEDGKRGVYGYNKDGVAYFGDDARSLVKVWSEPDEILDRARELM